MIIKCPECGHQVSDKAPVCPSCGVEIAGHLIKCSNCGELYFKSEETCPNCHSTEQFQSVGSQNTGSEDVEESEVQYQPSPIEEFVSREDEQDDYEPETLNSYVQQADMEEIPESEAEPAEQQNKNHVQLLVSFVIALAICGVLFYFYKQKDGDTTEPEAFEYTMKNASPGILEQFLEDYPDAPAAHTKAVKTQLAAMKQKNDERRKILQSTSRAEIIAFLKSNPSSEYKHELETKLDEMDWAEAVKGNSEESFLAYKQRQPNGTHNGEADEKLKVLLVHTASQADKTKAVEAVRKLLRGINTKNGAQIAEAVAPSFNFLGSAGATAASVEKYSRDKLYQADVKTVNWFLGEGADVTTEKNDDGTAEQHLNIPARLEINRQGGLSRKNYQIKAVVRNGKIVSINWTMRSK